MPRRKDYAQQYDIESVENVEVEDVNWTLDDGRIVQRPGLKITFICEELLECSERNEDKATKTLILVLNTEQSCRLQQMCRDVIPQVHQAWKQERTAFLSREVARLEQEIDAKKIALEETKRDLKRSAESSCSTPSTLL